MGTDEGSGEGLFVFSSGGNLYDGSGWGGPRDCEAGTCADKETKDEVQKWGA